MSNIAIYGAGAMGMATMLWAESAKYAVDYFLDKNEKRWGEKLQGVEVVNPEAIGTIGKETLIVVAMTAAPFYTIREYLIGIGFHNIENAGDFLQTIYPNILFANVWKLSEQEYKKASAMISFFSDIESQEHFIAASNWFYKRNEGEHLRNITSFDREKYFPCFLQEVIAKAKIFLDTAILDGTYIEKYRCYSKSIEKLYIAKLHPESHVESNLLDELRNVNYELFDFEFGDRARVEKKTRLGIMNPFTDLNMDVAYSVKRVDDIDEIFQDKIDYFRVYSMSEVLPILQGAKKMISYNRPIIAINVGHYRSDFTDVPMWIKKHYTKSKMYFRMHSYQGNDAILYVVPEGE